MINKLKKFSKNIESIKIFTNKEFKPNKSSLFEITISKAKVEYYNKFYKKSEGHEKPEIIIDNKKKVIFSTRTFARVNKFKMNFAKCGYLYKEFINILMLLEKEPINLHFYKESVIYKNEDFVIEMKHKTQPISKEIKNKVSQIDKKYSKMYKFKRGDIGKLISKNRKNSDWMLLIKNKIIFGNNERNDNFRVYTIDTDNTETFAITLKNFHSFSTYMHLKLDISLSKDNTIIKLGKNLYLANLIFKNKDLEFITNTYL